MQPTISPESDPGRLVRLLADRWTLVIMRELQDHGRRYQELFDALEGLSYKVLTETLCRAERDGLIARQLDNKRIETATLYELPI
jgi:DNA-binding HxlR family transcriptional regulator